MSDVLLRGVTRTSVSSRAGARVVAALTTEVAREAARRHVAQPAASVALGRGTTAGLLFATLSKLAEERVTLQILGDGPLGSVTVDARGDGSVRGFVRRPGHRMPVPAGRIAIGRAIGTGTVQVIRDLGLRDQYRGSTDLVSGEIDEDLEVYLRNSEQIESALGCDVILSPSGEVRAAGGVLIQCLPEGDMETVVRARELLRAGALHGALAGASDPVDLLRVLLGDDELEVQVRQPVAFRCSCSRERVAGALALCGEEEIRSMIVEDGGAEVTCNFCGERYQLGRQDLERLLSGSDVYGQN